MGTLPWDHEESKALAIVPERPCPFHCWYPKMGETFLLFIGRDGIFLASSEVKINLDKQRAIVEWLDFDNKLFEAEKQCTTSMKNKSCTLLLMLKHCIFNPKIPWLIFDFVGGVNLPKSAQSNRLAKAPTAATEVSDCQSQR